MSELARHLVELQRTRALKRTLAGVVRQELATILAARAAGYGYEQICQALEPMGVRVTARQLRDVVYRVRRERALAADRLQPQSAGRTATPASPRTGATAMAVLPGWDGQPQLPEALQPSRTAEGAAPGFVRQILSSPSEIEELARSFREGRAPSRSTPR